MYRSFTSVPCKVCVSHLCVVSDPLPCIPADTVGAVPVSSSGHRFCFRSVPRSRGPWAATASTLPYRRSPPPRQIVQVQMADAIYDRVACRAHDTCRTAALSGRRPNPSPGARLRPWKRPLRNRSSRSRNCWPAARWLAPSTALAGLRRPGSASCDNRRT